MTKKRSPNEPKGSVPPQLVGHGFDAHPEHINRKGRPKQFDALREMLTEMGNEEIEVEVGKGKNKQKIILTRWQKKILEMFGSNVWQNTELLLQYGFGKVPDKVEVSGLKDIHVTVKKPDDNPSS